MQLKNYEYLKHDKMQYFVDLLYRSLLFSIISNFRNKIEFEGIGYPNVQLTFLKSLAFMSSKIQAQFIFVAKYPAKSYVMVLHSSHLFLAKTQKGQ